MHDTSLLPLIRRGCTITQTGREGIWSPRWPVPSCARWGQLSSFPVAPTDPFPLAFRTVSVVKGSLFC